MTDFTQLSESDLKRVTTRDGRKVRILCVDGPEKSPVAAWIEGEEEPRSYFTDGVYRLDRKPCSTDLIIPPAERVVWVRSYEDGVCITRAEQQGLRGYVSGTDYRLTLGQHPTIERVE